MLCVTITSLSSLEGEASRYFSTLDGEAARDVALTVGRLELLGAGRKERLFSRPGCGSLLSG